LAATATWRREIGGVTDWLGAEVHRLGVDVRLSVYADSDAVTELRPDVVVIATGGVPDLEWLERHELCDSVWDVLSGSALVKQHVLLYDELGDHSGPSCAEVMADKGASVELAFRGHKAAERSGYVNFPVYIKHFYEKGIALTPDRRIIKVEKSGQQLRSTFENELTGQKEYRLSDQVVVERGTVPVDGLFNELRADSRNKGNVDMDRLLAGQAQETQGWANEGFELYRVGDAVSCRDIHCAILDSRRLCMNV
jgi:NADPH-dependent 2,4-dienoyl-CoA reductase/sulfur reductase-like enzyme